jgi:hypothetical protein
MFIIDIHIRTSLLGWKLYLGHDNTSRGLCKYIFIGKIKVPHTSSGWIAILHSG